MSIIKILLLVVLLGYGIQQSQGIETYFTTSSSIGGSYMVNEAFHDVNSLMDMTIVGPTYYSHSREFEGKSLETFGYDSNYKRDADYIAEQSRSIVNLDAGFVSYYYKGIVVNEVDSGSYQGMSFVTPSMSYEIENKGFTIIPQ